MEIWSRLVSVLAVQYGLAMRNFVGPGETPDVDELLSYAQRAEDLGFESLWVWDHILLGVQPAFPVRSLAGAHEVPHSEAKLHRPSRRGRVGFAAGARYRKAVYMKAGGTV